MKFINCSIYNSWCTTSTQEVKWSINYKYKHTISIVRKTMDKEFVEQIKNNTLINNDLKIEIEAFIKLFIRFFWRGNSFILKILTKLNLK